MVRKKKNTIGSFSFIAQAKCFTFVQRAKFMIVELYCIVSIASHLHLNPGRAKVSSRILLIY